MKKSDFLHIVILLIVLSLTVCGLYSTVRAQRAGNLYNFAFSAKKLSIYIGEFKSSKEAQEIDTDEIIAALKRRLEDRKTIDFNIANRLEDADLSITGQLTKFMYRENDPIDIFIPLGLVIDIFTDKNYARLEYEIEVFDLKKKKIVWKKRLKATATEFEMPKEESISLLTDRACYVFIKECFGRPKEKMKI